MGYLPHFPTASRQPLDNRGDGWLLFLLQQKMKGHLRLLNIACAAKAKWRQATLLKPSRESPLHFRLQGGSERGFGVFVDEVEQGSKAAEVGLKRGDQVGARFGGRTGACAM